MEDIIEIIDNPADGFQYTLTLRKSNLKPWRERRMKSLIRKLKNGLIKYVPDWDYPWLEVRYKKIYETLDDLLCREV